jgi:hypothetical protein
MVLSNEASVWAIRTCLTNVDWTEEEIDDFFEAYNNGDPVVVSDMEKIVSSLNEALERIHKESSLKFEEAIQKNELIEKQYEAAVGSMADEDGNVPFLSVLGALKLCNEAKQDLVKEIFEDLHDGQ